MSKNKTDMTSNLLGEIMQAQQTTPIKQVSIPNEETNTKMNKAQKTASVYLTAEQHAKLADIAKELETNKHAVMQLALRHFIDEWEKGYRPEPVLKKVYH